MAATSRRRQGRGRHRDLSPDDAALTIDASLSQVLWPIVATAVLSTVVAFIDGATVAGLAVRLTAGLMPPDPTISRFEALTSIPVLAGLVAVTLALNFANTLLREHLTTSWDTNRRLDLINAFREADFPEQSAYSGAGLSVATEQISRASGAIGATTGLLNAVIRTSIYIGIAAFSSWQVAVICIVTGSVLMGSLRLLTRRARLMHRSLARRNVEVGEEVGELAISSRELHTLNHWPETESRIQRRLRTIQRLKFRSSTVSGMIGPIYWAGTLSVGLAVAVWATKSDVTTASLAASGVLLLRSLTAAQSTQVMYQSLNDSLPYVERARSTIATLRRSRRPGTAEEIPDGHRIIVEHANLTYGRDVVVPDLNLSLQGPGGIALVGPSGSGKSTTVLALSGMGRPSAGVVSINGVPLPLLSSRELGAAIGLLPQHPQLLKGPLRSNLKRPETDASDDDLWEALEAVGLASTVRSFNGDMDTPVGRAAEGFSGGELQRLGLARLLVNRPPVWLVDEPTSALDRENSGRVLGLLTQAMVHHLVLVVTHRPELLHACSRVIFMEDGRVIDDGTLREVCDRQPFVAAMVAGDNRVADVDSRAAEPDSEPQGSGTSS